MSSVPALPSLATGVRSSVVARWWSRTANWIRSLKIDRAGAGLVGWMRRRLGPGIGVLEQFAPRAMCLPSHYVQTNSLLIGAPAISIVTPSYNQGRYLERTLQSVLGQNYPSLEYIVQDGGSRDESRHILERYGDRLHHVESVRDRGQAHAINLGFRHAGGGIMAYLNSDDLLLPGALHCVGRFFAEHPEVDVVYGNRIVINERDEEVGRWILPPHCAEALIWNNYLPQETMFWRRRIWDKAGGRFDESLHSALDWDLWLRFQRRGPVSIICRVSWGRFAFIRCRRPVPATSTWGCPNRNGCANGSMAGRWPGRKVGCGRRAICSRPSSIKAFIVSACSAIADIED